MKILKLELKKALLNKFFLAALVISMIFVVLSIIYCVSIYNSDMNMLNGLSTDDIVYAPETPIYTLFNHWIGGEAGSLGSSLFFFTFPVLCAMPYSWSYCVERKKGYAGMIIVQCGRKKYYAAKYIATFISGGLTFVIPMIVSIILSSLFFPVVKPEVIFDVYYGVFKGSLMSKLFYSKPFVYIILYMCIDFIICGLVTCCAMAAASFIKQKYVVMLVPFLLCLLTNYFSKIIYNSTNLKKEISFFFFMKPCQTRFPATFGTIGIVFAVLFVVTTGIIFGWERRKEFIK